MGLKVGNLSGTNYAEFETDGTLVFSGDAIVYKDLIIGVSGLGSGGAAPSIVNIGNVPTRGYSTGDSIFGSFELQHDYKEGTTLEAHIHWSPSSTNTGTAVFKFTYSVANMGTGAFTTEIPLDASQAGSGTQYQHQYLSLGTIAGTGRKIGDVIIFNIERLAAGNSFTGTALIHDIGIHYEVDTLGSRTRTGK